MNDSEMIVLNIEQNDIVVRILKIINVVPEVFKKKWSMFFFFFFQFDIKGFSILDQGVIAVTSF